MSEYIDTPSSPRTNQSAKPTVCATCEGDRFVTVRLRSPDQTIWMTEQGIQASRQHFHEEMAPCPDCNPIEVTQYRHDGTVARSMDSAATRQALTQ